MDIILSCLGLLVLSPLLLLIPIAIRLTSGRQVIFRQWRTGRYGRQFQVLKFRTMETRRVEGPYLTRSGDSRVTAMGKLLRKSKLDELPQLLNVLKGDMSLVGPRPDLEQFWNRTSTFTRRALALSPGLTGAASLIFRNEEDLLARVAPEHLSDFYVDKLLPIKAQLDLEYAARATFFSDCMILLRTIAAGSNPSSVRMQSLNEQLSR